MVIFDKLQEDTIYGNYIDFCFLILTRNFAIFFHTCVLQHGFATNWKASSKNRKASSEKAEGFLQRSLDLHAHKFPKHAALLTDLLS